MARIVLLHSALGLRPAVFTDAERLRAAGHEVATPDYYAGAVFADLDDGLAKRDAIGSQELLRRWRATAELGDVYAGYSLGAAAAQWLVETTPGARAGLFLHGASEPESPWPAGVPAQVHTKADDPWVSPEEIAALQASAGDNLTVFTYPGNAHLFADTDLLEYDAAASDLMWSRTLAFLAGL